MDAPSVDIQLTAQPTSCAFHPREYSLSITTVEGDVRLYSLVTGPDGARVQHQQSSKLGTGNPQRAVSYTSDGKYVLCASQSGSVHALSSSSLKQTFRVADAHGGEELYTITAVRDAHTFATGSEGGAVGLWDVRAATRAVALFDSQTDYITGLTYHSRDQRLVSTSADGTLAVQDLRTRKLVARSEDDADDEFLSCTVIKNGSKVAVGSQSGVVNLFSWGYFADCSDRFPGHPSPVDAMVAFDEDTVITGAGDGGLRILSVLPNALLGILGVHGDDEGVECLDMSADRRWLASVGHDDVVRLWSLQLLHEDSEEGSEGGAAEHAAAPAVASGDVAAPALPGQELAEGEADAAQDEGDECGTASKPRKRKKKRQSAKLTAQQLKQQCAHREFFSDL